MFEPLHINAVRTAMLFPTVRCKELIDEGRGATVEDARSEKVLWRK
jgi:hypothetical protein